jgi:hypothetical protein
MQVSSLTLSAIPIQEAPPPVISHQPTVNEQENLNQEEKRELKQTVEDIKRML